MNRTRKYARTTNTPWVLNDEIGFISSRTEHRKKKSHITKLILFLLKQLHALDDPAKHRMTNECRVALARQQICFSWSFQPPVSTIDQIANTNTASFLTSEFVFLSGLHYLVSIRHCLGKQTKSLEISCAFSSFKKSVYAQFFAVIFFELFFSRLFNAPL